MFSKACEYGIRAMLYIAVRSKHSERTRLKEIAREIGAPEAFTAKILQKLVKRNILCSRTGPKGGFYIEQGEINDTKLIQVVEAIDGNKIFDCCGLGLPKCSAQHPCPIHHKFKNIRADLIDMMTTVNVGQMADDVDNKLSFLKY